MKENKPRSVTLSISPQDMEILESIAQKHGCLWGDRPSVSELLRQIAGHKLSVVATSSEIKKREKLNLAISKAFSALLEIQQSLFDGD